MGLLGGKIIIITGAASGMGRDEVELFAKEGAKLALADIDLENLQKVASEYAADSLVLKMDVSSRADVDDLIAQTIEKYGRIDVVVNNAGFFDNYMPLMDTSEDVWNKCMNINAKGLFYITQATIPHMIEQEKGVFVNVVSNAALMGNGGGCAYTASKHAALGVTRRVATEFKQQGIRANAICPGLIETPMVTDIMKGPGFVEAIAKVSGRVGQPMDIASTALFLASDLSDYINGVALSVDGGMMVSGPGF